MSVTWLRAVSSRMMGLSVWSGKAVNRVDVVLDLVNHPAGIGAQFQLDHDRSHAFRSGRLELLDAVDALERLLDADDDSGLDLFGRRPKVRHLNADLVELYLRKDLFLDRRRGDEAAHDDEDHHEVGSHWIPREPGDSSVVHDRLPFLRSPHAVDPGN